MRRFLAWLTSLLPGVTVELHDEQWFTTDERRVKTIDVVDTADGARYELRQPVVREIDFRTGAIREVPDGPVEGPVRVTE